MGERARVLVVAAAPVRRRFLARALQGEGYEIDAADGTEAVACLTIKRRRPDVIVMDMRLSLADGLAFADAYRRAPQPHAALIPAPRTDEREDADHSEAATLELLRSQVRRQVSTLRLPGRRGRWRSTAPAAVVVTGSPFDWTIGRITFLAHQVYLALWLGRRSGGRPVDQRVAGALMPSVG